MKKNKNELSSEEQPTIPVKVDRNKEIVKKLCTENAYDIVYNKETKAYELITVKYAPDTDLAYVEKRERLDSDQVLAIDKLNRLIDSKLLNIK